MGGMDEFMPPTWQSPYMPSFTRIEEKYDVMERIRSDACGTILKAKAQMDGRMVTIKKVKIEGDSQIGIPGSIGREIALLRCFRHPNVVELIELVFSGPLEFNLVFGYEENDLRSVLKAHRELGSKMPMELVRKYTRELFAGLYSCHFRQILHRDLKPDNLLIGSDGLKITGFGLSRTFDLPLQNYTPDVVTLWYRAPELLLGALRYGAEVDIWSAGCIVAEMATSFPTFPGDSEIGTLFLQFGMLGTPTKKEWPGLDKLVFWKDSFPKWHPTELKKIIAARPEIGQEGIDLLRGLLSLYPQARMSSREAKNARFTLDVMENALHSQA